MMVTALPIIENQEAKMLKSRDGAPGPPSQSNNTPGTPIQQCEPHC